jgi:hypothetical protein
MPNSFALLMISAWPLVAVVLFRTLSAERAVIWTILAGYLVLPPVAAIDLPMIPPLDKLSIPALSAWACATLLLGHRVALLPRSVAGRMLLAVFVLAPVGTAVTNPDAIVYRGTWSPLVTVLPGLTLYDAFSAAVNKAFLVLILALGRHYLATPGALVTLLRSLVVAGLAYSLPMLVEVRMSPQINVWVYGFFQHSFEQMMRAGGFRPIVFLEHGLWVAFFAMTTILAATALARMEPGPARRRLALAAAYLFVVLVLCKSLGALVLAVAAVPLVALAGQGTLLRVAGILALVALSYPVLRAAGLVPVEALIDLARTISPERAGSLQFRFDNEAVLLERALERPAFGWGAWLRNLVLDPNTGREATVSDGRWIIALGIGGWAGFLAEFGLLSLPLLLLARLRRLAQAVPGLGAVALLHALNLVDLLPNATLTPLTWLVAGVLLGQAERLAAGRGAPVAAPAGGAVPARAAARPRTVL